MRTADIDALVHAFLMMDEAGRWNFRPSDDPARSGATEVLPGMLYRYHQIREDDREVTLQVFTGVGDLGVELWDQEVKVLLRVANLDHPALPEVLDGGHLEGRRISDRLGVPASNVAYVRTLSDEQVDLGEIDHLTRLLHGDRVWAVRQLWLLADALAILHDARIVHRNLWPGTLQVYGSDDRVGLRINRFEMSAMLSNVLRTTSVDARGRKVVRDLYLAQGARALWYAPPERLSFLLHEDDPGVRRAPTEGPGGPAADVFGLGMMAAEWFLGGFDTAELGAPGEGPPAARELLDFQNRVRRAVRISAEVPSALASLLDDMLDPNETGRPTAAQALERLSGNYDGIVSLLEGVGSRENRPHLLLYLDETRENLASWGFLDDPTERDPRVVARVIEEDLRGARVVEAPEGAESFLTNWRGTTPDKLRQARWVLLGQRAAWFCRPYELKQSRLRPTGDLLPDVYVIAYVAVRDQLGRAERDRLRHLEDVRLPRRIGAVDVAAETIAPAVLAGLRQGRPNWKALFETVREPAPLSPDERAFTQALDWLLEYQTGQLAARTYAFRRDPASLPRAKEVALHWDRVRDRERRDRMPALHAKLVGDSALRPAFGHFFAEAAHAESSSLPYLRISGSSDDFRFLSSPGEGTIVVASDSGVEVPAEGLVWFKDDDGTRTALNRQRNARDELVRNRVLVNRLLRPLGISGPADRWRGAAGPLRGEGAKVVVEMLRHQPIFVLQGPPGTGKTEISSQAVHAYLRADPKARVLISAQSHYALDNLAVRILTKLGVLDDRGRPRDADVAAIRVFHDRAMDRVDERLARFRPGPSAIRMRDMIRRRVRSRLDARVDGPAARAVAQSWLEELDGSEIELQERLCRGANLVFVTCTAATQAALVENGAREPFDWVLVEEAAKAWPTELALPLVRGLRWTMVGDHSQIGAYGAAEVERFLDSCRDDPDEGIRDHFHRKDKYLEVFRIFGTMISNAPPEGPRGQIGPVQRLREQRRMVDPISQVISRSFYPVAQRVPSTSTDPDGAAGLVLPEGLLETKRTDLRDWVLDGPAWLPDAPLIWLDTSGMRQDEGYWCNRYESRLVARLLRALEPQPLPTARHELGPRPGLAVLTPYRRQVAAIVQEAGEYENAVKTVDAFQGREADLVVVSLVRDTMRGPRDRPMSNIGHLADSSRVNVMLSRARDLLILVGSFEHFAGSGDPAWETVTAAVERFGVRQPVSAVDA